MSWQRGSVPSDPRASDVDGDHRLATAPRRMHSIAVPTTLAGLGRRLFGAAPSPERSLFLRRGAIGVLSGLLLIASALLPIPKENPIFAWGVSSDDIQTMTAASGGTDRGLHLPARPAPTAPPAEPERATPSSRGGSRPTPDISSPDKFIAAVAEAAQDSQLDSQVPASVTIAQAILESDWGQSQLSKKGQNYFGIKAGRAGPGPAGVINMNTWEVLSGANVVVNDAFKAYHNLWESIMDHGRFLADNPRYAAAFQVPNDAQEFARRIHAAGYATDPAYSTKLINLMNRFNLYQYDQRQ